MFWKLLTKTFFLLGKILCCFFLWRVDHLSFQYNWREQNFLLQDEGRLLQVLCGGVGHYRHTTVDYYRYIAEFATVAERKEAADNSLVAYKAAQEVAT